MESVKVISVPSNPVCNVCKNHAKIYHNGKWWCSLTSSMGEFNMKGYCNYDKKDKRKEDSD